MSGKLSAPGVNALQRPLLNHLRSGGWAVISKLPVPVGEATIDRVVKNGWAERRGDGLMSEIKLTPSGLIALQTPS